MLLQVQQQTDETDLPLIVKATIVLVWIALSVVIVVGGIFISNDQAAKRAIRPDKESNDGSGMAKH